MQQDETQDVKCQKLLGQMEDVYTSYLAQEKKFHQDLRKYQDTLEAAREEAALLSMKQKKFHESQYIEFGGKVVNCMNCSTFEEGEKCRCQQMYGQRPHLATLFPLQNVLTKEICAAKGYLDNHNIEPNLCLKHLAENNLHYSCNCPQAPLTTRPIDTILTLEPPKQPLLTFPSITCGPCRKEFEMLEGDFSHENVARVNRCIERLKAAKMNIGGLKNVDVEGNVGSLKNVDVEGNITGLKRPAAIDLTPPPVDAPPFSDAEPTETSKEKSKLVNILLIVVSLMIFIFSLYLVYCIYRNLPYDLVCSRVTVLQQAQQNQHTENLEQ